MHHADQYGGVVEQQRQRLIGEAGRDDEPVERAVPFEQQHPGERPHQHADPQRQQDAGEDYAAPVRESRVSAKATGKAMRRSMAVTTTAMTKVLANTRA